MTQEATDIPPSPREPIIKRIDEVGWAAFLIMTGTIWLFPSERIPGGTWLVGTGLLLLSVNAARAVYGIPISAFTMVLGAIALAGGLSELFGLEFPILAICLILFGASIILRLAFGRSPSDGATLKRF